MNQWNEHVEATPKVKPAWLVPAFFVSLPVITILAIAFYGQFSF